MTQEQRLEELIRYLLGERPDGAGISLPGSPEERFRLYRSLVNVRPPEPIAERYLTVEDEYLTELSRRRGVVGTEDTADRGNGLRLWQGDITRLRADAIVNAANSALLGCFRPCHSCIDNAIHTYAGVRLRAECFRQMQGREEPVGRARITPGYRLPARYVLHTVGPRVNGPLTREQERQLTACYRSCLELAAENGLGSVAFCCLSTGVFGFPRERAAELAVAAVRRYRPEPMQVIFNVYKDADRALYEALLAGGADSARDT